MLPRSLPVLLVLALLLAGCASLSTQYNPLSEDPINNAVDTSPEQTSVPTATYIPTATPTPLDVEVIVLTNQPSNILLTAANLQLDQNHIRLTEAANQIATLSAESQRLETKVAEVKTQSAEAAVGSVSSNYKIPTNVYTIVTTAEKAYIWVPYGYNDNQAPIMDLHEPRHFLPPGSESWVYKNAIKADGGALYYEIYDPDGITPDYKIYFQGKQIQLRLPNGSPNPANYPSNVAKAAILEKAAVHIVNGYDDAGKPIMETLIPYIHYNVNEEVILYPEFVIATGGSHWYPIYDPDGKPNAYLMASKVMFLYKWD